MRVTEVTGALRWVRRWAIYPGVLLLTALLLLAPAGPARAHAVLTSSSPAANAVLATAPTEVVLTFTETVRRVGDKIRVIGPDGERVDQGEAVFDDNVVSIQVDADQRGTYLVSYRVISADSHPVSGAYTYSVGAPSTPPTDTLDQAGDPAVAVAIPISKYLGYAGLVLLVGPVLVLSLLWPRRLSRRGPRRLIQVGAGLVAVATLAGLWLQAPYTNGGGLFAVSSSSLGEVLGSRFGAVHLVRLAILLAVLFLVRPMLAGRQGKADGPLLAILGITGLSTWPLAGHAAASPVAPVSVAADTVHVAGMAVWLGGLVMLAGFLLRRADERELAAILPIWSRWATLAVSALLLAGTVQALIEVATLDALTSTSYGRLVVSKVVLAGAVLAAAWYARRVVRRGSPSPSGLRRTVWVEVGVAAVILAISAALVQTTPARTAAANAGLGDTGYFSTRLSSSLYVMQVEIDPAATGSNTVHLYAYTPDNKPLRVVEWRARMALPSKGIEALEVPLVPFTDNHAVGEISLPAPGNWELRVTARTSDIDQATVTATVPVT